MTSLTQPLPTSTATAATAQTPKWQSTSYWVNLVALIASLVPGIDEWLKSNPTEFVTALAALNIVIKFITSGKWSLKEADSSTSLDNRTTGSGNTDPSPAAPVVHAVSTGSVVKLSLVGLIGLSGLGAASLGMTSCGHGLSYDENHGLLITKGGYTLTVTQPVKVTYSKK